MTVSGELGTYLTVLVLGIAATLVVGQVLLRTGRSILEDAFAERRTARSVNRLLAVLFHLGALGVLAVISTVDVPVTGGVQTVVTKLGVVLLILGAALGLLIGLFNRIRSRNREQQALDRMSDRFDTAPRPPRHDVPGTAVPRSGAAVPHP